MLLGRIFSTSKLSERKFLFRTPLVSKRRDFSFRKHFKFFLSYFTIGSEPEKIEKCYLLHTASHPRPLKCARNPER